MQINAMQVIMQIINFAILVTVLTKFLYKPILKILEARTQKIHDGLEAAEKSLEEKARTEEKKQVILTKAEQEAAEILDQARLDAKKAGKEMIAFAKTEAEESVAKEYQILQSKIQEEEQKVRRHIGELVAQTTTTVLQGALNEKAQRQIIRQQIQSLGKVKH